MKIRLTILAASCLLLACTVAVGQTDILSSVPADAYGFAAVKSPQAIVDRLKLLLPVLEEHPVFKDPLAPIRQVLGDVDFTGPAAVVMLKFDESDMDERPIALLISAANAGAVLQSHKDKAGAGEEQLSQGIVKISAQDLIGEDLYLAVKGDFVVVAFEPDMAAALANGQGSFEVLPEVRQAYEQGKIVLLADFQRIRLPLIRGLNETRSEVRAEVDQESEPADSKQIIERDMGLFSADLAQSFVEQLDKFIYILDVTDKGVYNLKVIFEADSPVAEFINAQIGQPDPSYKSIPSGAFLLAGALKIPPAQLDVITDALLAKAMTYPSLAQKLSQEPAQKVIADIRAFYGQFSGTAFSAGLGSPATGMLNFVARFDVADAAAFKQQIKEVCQSGFISTLIQDTGVKLIYTDAVESYAGVNIDTIAIRLANGGQDNPPTNEAMRVMQVLPMVIGADMSIRIAAPTEDQVLVIIGGGFERAERVINVANGHGSSLADYPKITEALAAMPPNRIAEVHQDLSTMFTMVKAFAPHLSAALQQLNLADMPLFSASCSVQHNTFRSDGSIATISIPSVAVAILVPAIQHARGQARAAVCATRVKGLDTALYLYANTHKGKYPDAGRWREALIEEDYATGEFFICPSVDGDPDKDNHYVLLPWPGPDSVDGNLLVIFERNANHNGRRHVIGGAHGVSIVSEAEFQEMLTKTIEALKARGIEFNWQE
ncbi:MAG: hypothetical protein KAT11_04245 [Phycisphaerae bacterium]|nr:hypothetical protein [Phycisphaerae bacterium]